MQCWKRVAWFTADLRVWALSQGMIFLKETAHPAPRCMVGPSSLVCMVVLPLACLFLHPDSSCWLCRGQGSLGNSAVWVGGLACYSSYGSALTLSPVPETVLALLFTSTEPFLLGLLLVSGYSYASKLGRDRTQASTTGLQLSWWNA